MEKSLLDVAYDYVKAQEKPVPFNELWSNCTKELKFSKEIAETKVARFYTNLLLDNRFVTLGENLWDLKERNAFEKYHVDMNEAYSDTTNNESDSEGNSDREEHDGEDGDENSDTDSSMGERDSD